MLFVFFSVCIVTSGRCTQSDPTLGRDCKLVTEFDLEQLLSWPGVARAVDFLLLLPLSGLLSIREALDIE